MMDSWEETVTAQTVCRTAEAGAGCLLQIHPLKVSDNLKNLPAGPMTIGRESSCGLCLPDSSVSRQHAVIEESDGQYSISDLNSTNGISVNEQRVASCVLTAGDRIQVGGFIFKFLSTNHIEMQYHEAVYSMMTRDGLTGTLNKRSFLDHIHREFHRAVHRHEHLSLILFDIDHFKSVNDNHGHLAGDDVLKEIGTRISTVIAEHDIFARYGGEEFAILLPTTTGDEAMEIAERCRAIVCAHPFSTSAGPLPIRISAGVADVAEMQFLATNASAEECVFDEANLVDEADQKLYEAKRSGRNRVCR
ncbi:MAG: GGDEF domain-containing protein [Fuerstiella sp.]